MSLLSAKLEVRGKKNDEKTLYFSLYDIYCNCGTVVGDNINILKTTFELSFNFYQGFTKIWKQREAVTLKSFTLITCKLVIRK